MPFERVPTIEIGGFTVKISYILATLLLLVFVVRIIVRGTNFNLKTSDFFLILFWVVSALTLFQSSDLRRSAIIIILWGFIFTLYFVLANYLLEKKLWLRCEKAIIVSTVLVCLFGIFQFLGDSFGIAPNLTFLRVEYTKIILGFPRIQSVALEPLYFANFLFVPLMIVFRKYIQEEKNKTFYFLAGALILTNIILTVSRGAYIAFGIAFISLLIYLIVNRKKENYLKSVLSIIAIFICSLAISFFLIRISGGGKNNNFYTTFSDHVVIDNINADGSTMDRIGAYKKAYEFFKTEPLVGIGIGNFGVKIKQTTGSDSAGYPIVNNEYLEILTETGIIGLILFLAFLIFYLKEIWQSYKRNNETEKFIIVTIFFGCLAIFIQYNFFSTLYIIYIWAFLALLRGEAQSEEI